MDVRLPAPAAERADPTGPARFTASRRQRRRWRTAAAATVSGLLLLPGPATATDAAAVSVSGRPDVRVDTVLTGAALPGANGLAVDRAGRLLVANGGGSRITTLDPDSGRVLDVLTGADGVTFPDDVVVGPDGAIYWTEFTTGEVVRRAPGDRSRTLARVGPGANPIAFAPDGRLFVARCFAGDALYEVDPAGRRPARVVAENIGNGCAANGMEFGPDGRLYAPQPLLRRIVAIDVDSARVDPVAGGFGPALVGLDFAPDGTVFAVDGPQLRRVDLTAGTSAVVAELPVLLDNLVIDEGGRIFVSGLTDASVVEVRRDGSARTVSPGGFVLPQGLALPRDGQSPPTLLVGTGAGVARVDTTTGRPVDVLGTDSPFAVASVSARPGRWVTTGPLEGTVRLFDPRTRTSSVLARDLNFPVDAVFFRGAVLVAEGGTGNLLRLPLAGTGPRVMMRTAGGALAGLASDGHDVWATDSRHGRLLQLIDDGRTLPRPRVLARGLDRPQALALGRPGELLVIEAGAGRLTALNLHSHRRQTLLTGLQPANPALPGAPTDGLYQGLTADRRGTVYVADTLTNRILRIRHVH